MYRTNRCDLGDPLPSQKGDNMKEVLIQLAETMNNPQKVRAYQAELANWEQAGIFRYRGTLIRTIFICTKLGAHFSTDRNWYY